MLPGEVITAPSPPSAATQAPPVIATPSIPTPTAAPPAPLPPAMTAPVWDVSSMSTEAKIDVLLGNLRATYELLGVLANEVKKLKKSYSENECWDNVRVRRGHCLM